MRDRGTLIVARSLVDHPVLATEPFDRRSAWLWLLTEAAWAARDIVVDNRQLALTVGELVGSSRFLAVKWQWTQAKTRRFLDALRKDGMIGIRIDRSGPSDHGITVIKITKFEDWQGARTRHATGTVTGTPSGTATGTPTLAVTPLETADLFEATPAPGTATGTHPDIGGISKPAQDIINNKKESKILRFQPKAKGQSVSSSVDPLAWPSDAFERWYEVYPRKKAPKAARRALDKLRVSGEITFPDLMAATERFAAAERARPIAERKFIPYPASWLNDGSYAEEPELVAKDGPPIRDPVTFTEADWSDRVRHFQRCGEWSGAWGPKPGAEGCKVPGHILAPRAALNGGHHG
jgi:hypothetical protein